MKKYVMFIIIIYSLSSCCSKNIVVLDWHIWNNTDKTIVLYFDSLSYSTFNNEYGDTIILEPNFSISFNQDLTAFANDGCSDIFSDYYIKCSSTDSFSISKDFLNNENWISTNSSIDCYSLRTCQFTINESDLVKIDSLK